jgi:hypothetical protein
MSWQRPKTMHILTHFPFTFCQNPHVMTKTNNANSHPLSFSPFVKTPHVITNNAPSSPTFLSLCHNPWQRQTMHPPSPCPHPLLTWGPLQIIDTRLEELFNTEGENEVSKFLTSSFTINFLCHSSSTFWHYLNFWHHLSSVIHHQLFCVIHHQLFWHYLNFWHHWSRVIHHQLFDAW